MRCGAASARGRSAAAARTTPGNLWATRRRVRCPVSKARLPTDSWRRRPSCPWPGVVGGVRRRRNGKVLARGLPPNTRPGCSSCSRNMVIRSRPRPVDPATTTSTAPTSCASVDCPALAWHRRRRPALRRPGSAPPRHREHTLIALRVAEPQTRAHAPTRYDLLPRPLELCATLERDPGAVASCARAWIVCTPGGRGAEATPNG
mmetsp:Transcript_118421/g.339984  ORF Transcript_118421/g.339984 Transcript_118421/m.339984 type:complete len:204 (-) Transcript_118421:4-615(-)